MEDELYLENIDEFVTDQNRVVTYKWLSYTLGVPRQPNQADAAMRLRGKKAEEENSGAPAARRLLSGRKPCAERTCCTRSQ
uniref:DNA polymerase delta subunit 3 n=1 Tax=Sphaerodactylus townsendi TaxID=933632 RepID=A0ACB8ENU0_9SAUR